MTDRSQPRRPRVLLDRREIEQRRVAEPVTYPAFDEAPDDPQAVVERAAQRIILEALVLALIEAGQLPPTIGDRIAEIAERDAGKQSMFYAETGQSALVPMLQTAVLRHTAQLRTRITLRQQNKARSRR
jgi:hypothetical protein